MSQLASTAAAASLKCAAVLLPLRRRGGGGGQLFSHDKPQNGNSPADLPSRGQPWKAEEPASNSSPSIHPSIPERSEGFRRRPPSEFAQGAAAPDVLRSDFCCDVAAAARNAAEESKGDEELENSKPRGGGDGCHNSSGVPLFFYI